MATTPFHYQKPFPLGEDKTEYYLLTKDYVSVGDFEGHPVLKVAPEGLALMANTAFRDVSFLLRRAHNEQVAKIEERVDGACKSIDKLEQDRDLRDGGSRAWRNFLTWWAPITTVGGILFTVLFLLFRATGILHLPDNKEPAVIQRE